MIYLSIAYDDDNIYRSYNWFNPLRNGGSDLNNCVGVTASTELCNTVFMGRAVTESISIMMLIPPICTIQSVLTGI